MNREEIVMNLGEKLDIFISDFNREILFSLSNTNFNKFLKAFENKSKNQSIVDSRKILIELILKEEYKLYKLNHNIRANVSPLRYPGAKGKVLNRFVRYFKTDHIEYREPFVGGGSIFLGKHLVGKNILNDKDYRVYAFLYAVKYYPEVLCEMIEHTFPTIELWEEKKNIINERKALIDTAFEFLFFNRTNYSGIFTANPLGGKQQMSKYKINCRWNSTKLSSHIRLMSEKLTNVEITNKNYDDIILKEGKGVFLIIDPPYYHKGNSLYTEKMNDQDHVKLSRLLRNTEHKYLLTIDDSVETREIYLNENTYVNQESWKYTVHSKKSNNIGKELFISNFKV